MKKILLTLLIGVIFGTCACAPAGAPEAATPAPSTAPTNTPSPLPPPTVTPPEITLIPSATPLPSATPIPFGFASTAAAAAAETIGAAEGFAPGLDVNPLTGKRPASLMLLERRPLAIKITNFPRSVRPQWGLNAADHVWEYYLEDELTRFVGIYYGQEAERVGPVRSARPFDEHILYMYKAILTFAYGDKRLMDRWVADNKVSPYMVIQKPDNCPPMCRIGAEDDYNNLFTNTAELSKYVSERGTSNGRQLLEGLRFEAEGMTASGGESADRVEIRFSPESYLYWDYQPGTRRYLRWQDTERRASGEESYAPLTDSLDGKQVAADNLVLLMVPSEYIYVSTSTDVIQHRLEGSGTGFAVRDGRIFPINWRRQQPADLVQLTLPSGKPYLLKPGNVWYEVLSDLTTYTSDSRTWRFIYDIPLVPTITPKFTATPTIYPLNP